MPLNLADPLLRMIPPDATPDVFLNLTPEQQARRGRMFLVMWAAGYPAWAAWQFALGDDAAGNEFIDFTLSQAPDEEIPKMVQGRIIFDRVNPGLTAT